MVIVAEGNIAKGEYFNWIQNKNRNNKIGRGSVGGEGGRGEGGGPKHLMFYVSEHITHYPYMKFHVNI